jgi:hypothetical protein
MTEFPLSYESNHLYAKINNQLWLIDTGSPISFGDYKSIVIEKEKFELPHTHLGITATLLSKISGAKCSGLIGMDILENFDILFDLLHAKMVISIKPLSMFGEQHALEDFMSIPIIKVKIAGVKYKMFFDTGSHICYLQNECVTRFPDLGQEHDFLPMMGEFVTNTYNVKFVIGKHAFNFQTGRLQGILGTTLLMSGVEGVLGNSLVQKMLIGFFPRRNVLCV